MALKVGNIMAPEMGNNVAPEMGKPYGPKSILLGNTYGPRQESI